MKKQKHITPTLCYPNTLGLDKIVWIIDNMNVNEEQKLSKFSFNCEAKHLEMVFLKKLVHIFHFTFLIVY